MEDEAREVPRMTEQAVEDICDEKTLLEHILLLPDKFIGKSLKIIKFQKQIFLRKFELMFLKRILIKGKISLF